MHAYLLKKVVFHCSVKDGPSVQLWWDSSTRIEKSLLFFIEEITVVDLKTVNK